jgi:hypothetical protein
VHQRGFEPDIVYESGQWDFIGEMVASDFGISFLPDTVCNKLDPKEFMSTVHRYIEEEMPKQTIPN